MEFVKGIRSVNILRSTYFAFIHSLLRRGIFFGVVMGKVKKIVELQKQATRSVCNIERDTSCRVLFETLNILPVYCMYIMETVYYVKMNIGGLEKNSVMHDYNTCHRSALQFQCCRTVILKKCK